MQRINIFCLADTHGRHRRFRVGGTRDDIFVFCGDFMNRRKRKEIRLEQFRSFVRWVSKLPHFAKIVCGGNHDCEDPDWMRSEFEKEKIIFLINQTLILRIPGTEREIVFFASPNSHCPAAFNKASLREVFACIPSQTDFLVTHIPCKGRFVGKLALHRGVKNWGSNHITRNLKRLTNLKAHFFGHVHMNHRRYHGKVISRGTIFINCSRKVWKETFYINEFRKRETENDFTIINSKFSRFQSKDVEDDTEHRRKRKMRQLCPHIMKDGFCQLEEEGDSFHLDEFQHKDIESYSESEEEEGEEEEEEEEQNKDDFRNVRSSDLIPRSFDSSRDEYSLILVPKINADDHAHYCSQIRFFEFWNLIHITLVRYKRKSVYHEIETILTSLKTRMKHRPHNEWKIRGGIETSIDHSGNLSYVISSRTINKLVGILKRKGFIPKSKRGKYYIMMGCKREIDQVGCDLKELQESIMKQILVANWDICLTRIRKGRGIPPKEGPVVKDRIKFRYFKKE